MSYLNPFSEIVNDSPSPHSRTLRNGFFKKLKDAFFVFSGRSENKRTDHVGLIDYATLGIPLIISSLSLWSMSNLSKHGVAAILLIPTTLFRFFWVPIKYSVSAALMLATMPITAVVDLVSSIFSRPLKNKLKAVRLEKEWFDEHSDGSSYKRISTVGAYMASTGVSTDSDNFLCKTSEPVHDYSLVIGKLCIFRSGGLFNYGSVTNDCQACFEGREHCSIKTNADVEGYEAAFKLGFNVEPPDASYMIRPGVQEDRRFVTVR